MSLSAGQDELHRATIVTNVSVGGTTADIARSQATEDRRLVGVSMHDSGGPANVSLEVSFASQDSLSGGDNTRASTIAFSQGQTALEELDIDWSAGEEIHLHGRNNSGNSERAFVVLYYREV